jgi:hypothetical protein
LPGGEYGFYPQVKVSSAIGSYKSFSLCGGMDTYGTGTYGTVATSYFTCISMIGDATNTGYAQQRYVTASGEDHWIFLLVDKVTGNIVGGYEAPDHPSYGNGGDSNLVQHPFPGYDPNLYEVVVVDKATTNSLIARKTRQRGILEIINEEMQIGDDANYVPLHTGKYLYDDGTHMVQERIMSLPQHIKCKKLKNKP